MIGAPGPVEDFCSRRLGVRLSTGSEAGTTYKRSCFHVFYLFLFPQIRRRVVLPTGTLGSSMGYFKRKTSPSQSEELCSWDGKGATREARGRGFKSEPNNILRDFGGLRYRLFYPVPKTWAFGTAFGVPVQETGTKGQSQPVPMALFLVVEVLHVDI